MNTGYRPASCEQVVARRTSWTAFALPAASVSRASRGLARFRKNASTAVGGHSVSVHTSRPVIGAPVRPSSAMLRTPVPRSSTSVARNQPLPFWNRRWTGSRGACTSSRIVSLRTTLATLGPVKTTVTVLVSAGVFGVGGVSCQSSESATAYVWAVPSPFVIATWSAPAGQTSRRRTWIDEVASTAPAYVAMVTEGSPGGSAAAAPGTAPSGASRRTRARRRRIAPG